MAKHINTHKKRKKLIREEKTIERLERELREAKSLIRSLQKRLRKVDKGFKEHEIEDVQVEEAEIKNAVLCEVCGKGSAVITIIGNREIVRCSICEHRSSRKINGKKD
jgi:hypothetical protein